MDLQIPFDGFLGREPITTLKCRLFLPIPPVVVLFVMLTYCYLDSGLSKSHHVSILGPSCLLLGAQNWKNSMKCKKLMSVIPSWFWLHYCRLRSKISNLFDIRRSFLILCRSTKITPYSWPGEIPSQYGVIVHLQVWVWVCVCVCVCVYVCVCVWVCVCVCVWVFEYTLTSKCIRGSDHCPCACLFFSVNQV